MKLLNIRIKKYWSCEIAEDPLLVSSSHNEDGLIEYIGDAKLLTKTQIEEFCPVDLLLGAPPCNDLSRVNPKRKHFGKKKTVIMAIPSGSGNAPVVKMAISKFTINRFISN